MGKKGYKIAFWLALGASAVLYVAAHLFTLAFPSSEGTLAVFWAILVFAVIFAVSVVSRWQGEWVATREFTQDIILDMIPPGKKERFQLAVLVDCFGPKKQYFKLLRDITKLVVE